MGRKLDALGLPRSALRDAGNVGQMFDFVDPDGIQLELIFIDQAKLRLSATYAAVNDANANL
jgi:hypothetical protein